MIKMMYRGILIALTLTCLSLVMSGCAQREPEVVVKKEYVYEKPFEFQIYDTKGMRIDAGSKEVQRMCTPLVLKVGGLYRGFIDGYEDQIEKYKEIHDNR